MRYRTRAPVVVRAIVAINVMVFLAWSIPSLNRFMVENFLVSWAHLVLGHPWVLLTSAFSQSQFFHLLINMVVLVSFGGQLERLLGHSEFLTFYLLASVVSSGSHALTSNFLLGQPALPALGASGAVAGLVLLFALLFPKAKILLFGIIPLPALFGALAFVAIDVWGMLSQMRGGGFPIGHGAHLGGALTGLVYFLVRRKQLRLRYTVRGPG